MNVDFDWDLNHPEFWYFGIFGLNLNFVIFTKPDLAWISIDDFVLLLRNFRLIDFGTTAADEVSRLVLQVSTSP